MKIALVTETFPPEVNGVAMTLNRLVNGIAALGEEVTVVRPKQKADQEDPSTETKPYGDWLVPGVALPKYEGLMMGLPVSGRLSRGWRDDRPDVVHIATEGPLGWAALGAAAKLGIPISSSFHTNFHQYGDHYGYGSAKHVAVGYLKAFHNQTAVTMVPTRQMRDMLTNDGYRNVKVVSRGVDTKLFSPEKRSVELRKSWGVGEGDPVVIYVGRLAREKNIALAVKSFLQVQKIQPNAHFVLVGDGPERPSLMKKHPEFHFAGMQRGEDLAAHYASGDIFLFPSITETFGNVVTEALASGLVVVTYDYAAGREHITHGRNGVLAKFDDADDYVRLVSEVSQHQTAWQDLRIGAREVAESITWERVFGCFREILQSVAEQARQQEAAV